MTDSLSSGIKRDFLTQMGKLGNGFHPNVENNIDQTNDAKKVKVENNFRPSKVVHIRNLATENESEIIQLGMHFGRVTNILILKGKGQAFLELTDVQAAINMVDYYEKNPVTLHNRRIFVQYSYHQELKTNNSNVQPSLLHNNSHIFNQQQDSSIPNSILKVVVENMVYPITTDVLLQIFLPFGSVLKIITFNRNNIFHALVQYPDILSAQKAKNALNGQNIYNACDTLCIEFSDLTNLQIKSLEDGNKGSSSGHNHSLTHHSVPGLPTSIIDHHHHHQALVGSTAGINLHNIISNTAGMPHGSPAALQAATAALAASSPLAAAAAAAAVNSLNSPFNLHNSGFNNHLAGIIGVGGGMMPQGITVLLVTNLNEEKITAYGLFILFGVYGDVQRVKILYNKKSNALVQMADTTQLSVAMSNLNKHSLYGKIIGVVPSKIQNIQMPKEDHADSELTKDFVGSPLHRFKKPGSKNFQNIAPPSNNLHISNIPANTSEDFLMNLFSQDGRHVKNFRFFPKDPKMALIQMINEEEAIDALICLHNYKIGESYIRVSFSKIAF